VDLKVVEEVDLKVVEEIGIRILHKTMHHPG
jgi:hypothetical protein